MADHSEAVPRLQVTIERDDDGKWRWIVKSPRPKPGRQVQASAGPYHRIESCVANLETVLGVTCEWVKFRKGPRRLIVIGRPVDVTIQG